jgi:hypothetical protein
MTIPNQAEVEVPTPSRMACYRWMFAYWLIKLASRIYPMQVDFYRNQTLEDRVINELHYTQ